MASALLSEFSKLLGEHQVDCILIDGWAASQHGSMRNTVDIDFVYSRKPENVQRLVEPLSGTEPYSRGAPPGLPFKFDEETVNRGLNFTLTTNIGDIDFLGEVTGGGTYEELLPATQQAEINGFQIQLATLETLIKLKRATGRPKDFEALAELEALMEELDTASE